MLETTSSPPLNFQKLIDFHNGNENDEMLELFISYVKKDPYKKEDKIQIIKEQNKKYLKYSNQHYNFKANAEEDQQK